MNDLHVGETSSVHLDCDVCSHVHLSLRFPGSFIETREKKMTTGAKSWRDEKMTRTIELPLKETATLFVR